MTLLLPTAYDIFYNENNIKKIGILFQILEEFDHGFRGLGL